MKQFERARSRGRLRLERTRADHAAVDVLVRTVQRYSDDDCGTLAAALTYYLFFSVFPMLLFAASVLGYLTFGNDELRETIFDASLDAVPLLGTVIQPATLDSLTEARGTLALTALALTLYAGTGGIVALGHALSRIARSEETLSWWKKRLESLKWLAFVGIGAAVTAGLGVATGFAGDLFGGSGALSITVQLFGRLLGVLVSAGLFATAFKFLGPRPAEWQEVLPGAVTGAVAFEAIKVFGAVYLAAGVGNRRATFGAFAAAAGLLVASYLLAQIVLYAAELNAALAERRSRRQSSPRPT